MSSEPKKFEYLCVVPDFPGVQEKRLAVRPQHFANLKPKIDAGWSHWGGAILNRVPKHETDLDFAGSALTILASSKEEVVDFLKSDVYAKEGVWDLDKAQIYPFKCALRLPLEKKD